MNLDTSEMEARLERRICARVEEIVARALAANGHGRDRLLSLKQVAERVGKSKRTVADMVKRGEFPSRTAVVGQSQMWEAAVVEEWVRERGNG